MYDQDQTTTTDQVKTYPTAPDAEGYFFASQEAEEQGERSRLYPTKPDAEGFFYESDMFEAMGIETKQYENGNTIMRCTLSTGAVAVCRELKGIDGPMARKIAGGREDRYEAALAALATKIDDKEWAMEDLLHKLKMKDYNKVNMMSNKLNF
jgi:hypothetical protein